MSLPNSPLLKPRSKASRAYYQAKDALLQQYEEDDEVIKGGGPSDNKDEATQADNLLSKIVLGTNVFLLVAKAAATYLTSGSSLSIISTLLDSVVDITSGLAIWYATYAIIHTNHFKYPRGRANLEIISIIFIGIVMGMANGYIVITSITTMLTSASAPDITLTSLLIIVATIVLKALLWIACLRNGSSSSKVLAIDQRNDVMTNIVAILGAALSQLWNPLADPIAAILISGYVAYSWLMVVLGEMPNLVGVSCTPDEFSRVARILTKHSNKIRCIDTLLIYHTGEKVRVEAHVVLNPEMGSREVHDDIVEPLQKKIMCLDFVDRAFIHPDYECDGYDK